MNVGILVVDESPPPICFGGGSVARQETRRMIK
jgi:hypothetical protein